MKSFKLEIPAYGHGRSVGEARYQWIGSQLIKTIEDFLTTNWGSHSSSRGVIYGHFNELSKARVSLPLADPMNYMHAIVPLLKRIREDLLSDEAREKSMAQEHHYAYFIQDFDGYLEAFETEVEGASRIALLVQDHCRPFAGDVDEAWRRARRLDPDQPSVETDFFHELARLRDRVFEQPNFTTVKAYLDEADALKDGLYGTLVAYARSEARREKLLQNHDLMKLEAMEDDLFVEALWADQARG